MNQLTKFDAARLALAEAHSIDEVKEIRDKMEALRLYLKQQGEGLIMQNQCAEIKLRAERKAGELLGEMKANGEVQKQGDYQKLRDATFDIPTIIELGLDKYESHRFQLIASLPEPDFEEEIATVLDSTNQELTTSRMLKKARRYKAKEDKKEPPPLTGKYRIIYADPPWKYGDSGLDNYGHAERHYPSMSIPELCALPVKEISEDNAVLFLWVTSPLLEDGFKVINAWGFEYKTSFVWDKIKHNYGHYNSVRHEFLLVCTKGNCTPDDNTLFDSVQSIERSAIHSQKPDEFRKIIETLYTYGEKIELFAREKTDQWITWGNEEYDTTT